MMAQKKKEREEADKQLEERKAEEAKEKLEE